LLNLDIFCWPRQANALKRNDYTYVFSCGCHGNISWVNVQIKLHPTSFVWERKHLRLGGSFSLIQERNRGANVLVCAAYRLA